MPGRAVDDGGPGVTHSGGAMVETGRGAACTPPAVQEGDHSGVGCGGLGQGRGSSPQWSGQLREDRPRRKDVRDVKTGLPRVTDHPCPSTAKGLGVAEREGPGVPARCRPRHPAPPADPAPALVFPPAVPDLCPQPWDTLPGKCSSIQRGLAIPGLTH